VQSPAAILVLLSSGNVPGGNDFAFFSVVRISELCFEFNLCYLYSLVKIWIVVFCSIWFSLVLCAASVL